MPSIRPYRRSDREAVRAICVETALFGGPAEGLAGDAGLVADALSSYYTDAEPESLLVAVKGDRVCGYISGCVDTRRFDRVFAARVVPRLMLRFLAGGFFLRPRALRLLAVLAGSVPRRARAMRGIPALYPAHCHINIAPGFRGSGTGSALLAAFLEYLRARGVPGIHVSVPGEGGKAFFARKGFSRLSGYEAPRIPGAPPREVWLMGLRLG